MAAEREPTNNLTTSGHASTSGTESAGADRHGEIAGVAGSEAPAAPATAAPVAIEIVVEEAPRPTPPPSAAAGPMDATRLPKRPDHGERTKAGIAAAKAAGAKLGRPRVKFDLGIVRAMGAFGASHREMASILKCPDSTVTDRMQEVLPEDDEEAKQLPEDYGKFRAAYNEGLGELKGSLRRAQITQAMRGNVRMLTWLGMQYLGQANVARGEITNKGQVDQNFTFTIKQGSDEEGKEVTEIAPGGARTLGEEQEQFDEAEHVRNGN